MSDDAPLPPAPALFRPLRPLLAATMFLTRLPVPGWTGHSTALLGAATAWFPVVGAGVGLLGGIVLLLATPVWSPLVAAVLATVATVLLTGAFHEDALADACDGLGGGWSREDVLRIMKDSRVGSYALVGVTLVLLLKVGALAVLGEVGAETAARALVAGHVLGRWSSLPLIRFLPYARPDGGTGKPFAAGVTDARLLVGTGVALALTWLVVGASGWLPWLAAVLITAAAGRYFTVRLGGMTGDCLGAANQLVEVATYLLLAARWP